MKKNRWIFFILSFYTYAAAATCNLDVSEKILGCLDVPVYKNLNLAVHDGANGISLTLFKEGKAISSVTGLGYVTENFDYMGQKLGFKIISPKKFAQNLIAIRVKNDTTSLLSFYVIKNEKLVLVSVNENKNNKDFIVTNFGAEVKIDQESINVFDSRYSAFYKFAGNEIELTKYKPKKN